MESKAPIYIETFNNNIVYNRNTMCFEVRGYNLGTCFESYTEAVKAWRKAKATYVFIVYEQNEMSPHAFFSTKEKAEKYVRLLQSARYTIEEQILDEKEV